ncbi:MAG: hypothetical protein AB7D51_14055 [Desulfovibrionaceae bacterium]
MFTFAKLLAIWFILISLDIAPNMALIMLSRMAFLLVVALVLQLAGHPASAHARAPEAASHAFFTMTTRHGKERGGALE